MNSQKCATCKQPAQIKMDSFTQRKPTTAAVQQELGTHLYLFFFPLLMKNLQVPPGGCRETFEMVSSDFE